MVDIFIFFQGGFYERMEYGDPKNLDEMVEYHKETAGKKDRMPLPSLMMLKDVHEALGKENKCMFNEVRVIIL